ncbi:uncharacterized protein [Montipora foliosa]|uniref:uncharacterized protein isoform X1 n=1 Tax=Montipora foliosa TaxID=591990 RepID=UPI0035F1E02C
MKVCYFSVRELAILFWLWLACVENKTYAVQDLSHSACRSLKFFPPRDGQYLEGHVFMNFTVDKYSTPCEQRCVMDRKCVSINIGQIVKDETICELSDSDHNQHSGDVKSRPKWTYRFTENPCNSAPCHNSGKCFVGYTEKKYACQCLPGFTGEHCEHCEKAGALNSSSILDNLDGKYLNKLNCFLAPVLQSPSRSRFMRCWRAKTDGWAASTFHSNCDGKGPTVTIIKVGSFIFGGYTDQSWSSSNGFALSKKSFIYSLHDSINGYAPVKREVKSRKQNKAIYRLSSYGPTFGDGYDIHISNNADSNRNSHTNCGKTYPLPPGYPLDPPSPCTFYAGGDSNKFTPTDIEVFYETIL